MTFLAVMALAASFALSAMTQRWSSGLENRVTVEIPAEAGDGSLRDRDDVKTLTNRINAVLTAHPAVDSTHILSDEEIQELVRPWLGDNLLLSKVPVPGLIAVTLDESGDDTLRALDRKIREIADNARIDTHEAWLRDLLRFTGALQFAAALLTLVIGVTTAIAVAGAVRSRMAEHSADVELLHLMGASDNYIARQFQRHSMALALQGGAAGTLAGGLSLLIIGWISGEMGVNLLPEFRLSQWQIGMLAALPLAAALLAIFSARKTVINVLTRMP